VAVLSRDGGVTWGDRQQFDNTGWLNSISCATTENCWAAGWLSVTWRSAMTALRCAASAQDRSTAIQLVPMSVSGTSRRKISAVLGPTPLKCCSRWLISSRVLAVRTSLATEPS